VKALLARDVFELTPSAFPGATIPQQLHGGVGFQLLDIDLAVAIGAMCQWVVKAEAGRNQQGDIRYERVGDSQDKIPQSAIVDLAEGTAPGTIVLDFFQSIENQQTWSGRRQKLQQLVIRKRRLLCFAIGVWRPQPGSQFGNKRIRIWSVIERERKDTTQSREIGVFRNLRMLGISAGNDLEKTLGNGGFSTAANANQGEDTTSATGPPVTHFAKLRTILPVAGSQQAMDE